MNIFHQSLLDLSSLIKIKSNKIKNHHGYVFKEFTNKDKLNVLSLKSQILTILYLITMLIYLLMDNSFLDIQIQFACTN